MPWAHDRIMSKEFLIPISLVFSLLGAAMSYGVVYNKVDNLEHLVTLEREDRKEDIAQLSQQIETLNSLLTQVLASNGETVLTGDLALIPSR